MDLNGTAISSEKFALLEESSRNNASEYARIAYKQLKIYLGKFVVPIRNSSMARAQRRPSRIAQTTSDCPRRMSPAENTFGREVW